MDENQRCTCAGVRRDWINRHSFSVNDSWVGMVLMIDYVRLEVGTAHRYVAGDILR